MCMGCWQEVGSPTELPDDWEWIVERIEGVYSHWPAGGPLHVELDDWNLECFDDSDNMSTNYYEDDDPKMMAYARTLWHRMKELSMNERGAVLAKFDGYYE